MYDLEYWVQLLV